MNEPSQNSNHRNDPELEARIVALVLGEVDELERSQLQALLIARPELLAFKDEIECVHGLLHSVSGDEWVGGESSWKLPSGKRSAVLDLIEADAGSDQSDSHVVSLLSTSGWTLSRVGWSLSKVAAVLCVAGFFGFVAYSNLSSRTDQTVAASVARPSGGSSVAYQLELQDSAPVKLEALGRFQVGAAPREGSSSYATVEKGLEKQNAPGGPVSEGLEFGAWREQGGVPGMGGGGMAGGGMGGMPGGGMPGMDGGGLGTGPISGWATLSERKIEGIEDGRRFGDVSPDRAEQPSEPSIATSDPAEEYSKLPSAYYLDDDVLYFPAPIAAGEQNSTRQRDDDFKSLAESVGEMKEDSGSSAGPKDKKSFDVEVQSKKLKQGNWFAESLGSDKLAIAGDKSLGQVNRGTAQQDQATNAGSTSGLALNMASGDTVAVIDESLPRILIQDAWEVELAQRGETEREFKLPQTDGLEQAKQHTRGWADDLGRSAALLESNAKDVPFSTFSLHVSDVSFKLALAAFARGEWPDAERIRIEEFVNAFDYGDPLPSESEKVACRVEQAIHPFLQQRNLLRVSMRTSAQGRSSTTPLRLTLLLDNSGSMERFDRQQTLRRAFTLLAQQLTAQDQVTLISFARQPRLLADKVSGDNSQQLVQLVESLPSEGGTNFEAALQLAFEKAKEQQLEGAQNRVILLTDGAVNLGDASPVSLSSTIAQMRDAGVAFDAAGISAEGLNDEVLEALTRQGDGRYYLLDSLESADDGFARQIAGALRPSAKNVKVQVEFNPNRVGNYKLLGFEQHRLKQEDFRNDAVDAAEMTAEEAGVAVYQFEAKPDGEGDVGSVSVRFLDIATGEMVENRWPILYDADTPRPEQASSSLRLAMSAALFAAKLRGEALGQSVDLKTLSELVSGLPEQDRNAIRVQQLQQMLQQAQQAE